MSKVIILDFGSQVTQLIARRVREAGVYSEIHPCVISAAEVAAMHPDAVILSGGPASVGEKDAPRLDRGILELGVPVLGICYGMQLLAHELGGELAQSETREYGPADLEKVADCPLWDGMTGFAGAKAPACGCPTATRCRRLRPDSSSPAAPPRWTWPP